MALCCLLPLALLALLPLTGWNFGNLLYFAIALICPIGMIVMMFMGRGCHSSKSEADEHNLERAGKNG